MTEALSSLTVAFWVAFGVAAILAKPILSTFLSLNSRQTVSAYAPEGHQKKQGTPTMGGLIVVAGALAAMLVSGSRDLASIVLLIGFALIGFVDDFVVPRRFVGKRGLGWRQKILMQLAVAVGAALLTRTNIAGIGLIVFLVLFFSNAYNFSDGIDALAGTLLLGLGGGLLAMGFFSGMPLAWLVPLAALLGGIVPFLYVNAPPARVFMGDVGSLPIGAVLGYVVARFALGANGPEGHFWINAGPLLTISLVMVVELVPQPLQILSVKLRKKRIFPYTPIHGAFEKAGWPETRVMFLFALTQLLLSVLAIGFVVGLPQTPRAGASIGGPPMIAGQRIVAMGLGRSGLAVARAALARGASAIVVDEKAVPAKPELVEEARAEGIDVRLGWSGAFADLSPDLVVVNPAVDSRHPKLQNAGVELVSEVEFAYRIARGPIVAITGTNGKSTTSVMAYLALRACGLDPLLCGNLYGSGYPEAPLTEAALAGREGQPLVAEISSFGLEWTSTFRPRAAGITTINPDHLDRYDSFEEYAATKMRIFAGQTDEDYAVVRANDPVVAPPCGGANAYVPRHRRRANGERKGGCPHVLTFGATGEHARVEELDLVVLDTRIPLAILPWTEPHNHANAACAALLSYGLLKATGSPLIDKAMASRPKPSIFSARREEPSALPPEIVAGPSGVSGPRAPNGAGRRARWSRRREQLDVYEPRRGRLLGAGGAASDPPAHRRGR